MRCVSGVGVGVVVGALRCFVWCLCAALGWAQALCCGACAPWSGPPCVGLSQEVCTGGDWLQVHTFTAGRYSLYCTSEGAELARSIACGGRQGHLLLGAASERSVWLINQNKLPRPGDFCRCHFSTSRGEDGFCGSFPRSIP